MNRKLLSIFMAALFALTAVGAAFAEEAGEPLVIAEQGMFSVGGTVTEPHELAFGTQNVDFDEGANNTRIKRMSDIERWAKDVYSFPLINERY